MARPTPEGFGTEKLDGISASARPSGESPQIPAAVTLRCPRCGLEVRGTTPWLRYHKMHSHLRVFHKRTDVAKAIAKAKAKAAALAQETAAQPKTRGAGA